MILAACFTLRGHGTHIDLLWFFFSGRQDLPSDARVFTLTSFEALSFLLRPNKGFQFSPKCLLDLNN